MRVVRLIRQADADWRTLLALVKASRAIRRARIAALAVPLTREGAPTLFRQIDALNRSNDST